MAVLKYGNNNINNTFPYSLNRAIVQCNIRQSKITYTNDHIPALQLQSYLRFYEDPTQNSCIYITNNSNIGKEKIINYQCIMRGIPGKDKIKSSSISHQTSGCIDIKNCAKYFGMHIDPRIGQRSVYPVYRIKVQTFKIQAKLTDYHKIAFKI